MEHDLSFLDRSNLKWLKNNTIFLTVHGSHAYGLATETSDVDYKGIAIPPINYFTGIQNSFEQAEFKAPNPDCCIFNLQKWMKLACDNNPSVVEILWTDPEFYIISSKYWDKILEHRDKFLSKNIKHRFSGYAVSQIKKMKRHYRFLHYPVKEPPKRSDFKLPEYFSLPKNQLEAVLAMIQKRIDQWNPDLSSVEESKRIDLMNNINNIMVEIVGASLYLDKEELWEAAATNLGMDSNFIELIQKEKEYKQAKDDWDHYIEWKNNRNPKRAALENKIGYDAKDAAAFVRIMRMALEILTTGKVNVKRQDRDDLLDIKKGNRKYEDLLEYAIKLDQELNEIYKTSELPNEPDRKFIDALCQEIIEEFIFYPK